MYDRENLPYLHLICFYFRITFDKLKESLDKFIEMSKSHTGEITLEELAEYLGVPVSDSLREMFNVYDRVGPHHFIIVIW